MGPSSNHTSSSSHRPYSPTPGIEDLDDEIVELSREAWGLNAFGHRRSYQATTEGKRRADKRAADQIRKAKKGKAVDYDFSISSSDEERSRDADRSRRRQKGLMSSDSSRSPERFQDRHSSSLKSSPPTTSIPSPKPSPTPSSAPPTPPPGRGPYRPRRRRSSPRAPRSEIETAASIFIQNQVDLVRQPGVAYVELNDIERALATTDDLTNKTAVDFIALLHTVDKRLRVTHNRVNEVRWPPGVIINQKTIPRIRSIRNQGFRRKKYTGVRECSGCAGAQRFAHGMAATCLADPVERAGCFCCRANKRLCDQKMVEGNKNFVSSKLRHVRAERAAVDSWSEAMDAVIRLAHDLQLELANHPAATSLTDLATRLLARLFAGDGVMAVRTRWERERQEVGAENNTRIGDAAGARLNRKLDQGKELVWSMREVIRAEIQAYDRYTAACTRVDDFIRRIEFDLVVEFAPANQPLPHRNIVSLLRRIVDEVTKDGGIRDIQEEVKEARGKLGKPSEE